MVLILVLKQIFKLNREYGEAKQQLVEQSVKDFEAKVNPLFVVLFFTLLYTIYFSLCSNMTFV